MNQDERNSKEGLDAEMDTNAIESVPKEKLDMGSKSWSDIQKDKHQYTYASSFPSCTKARTTFWSWEGDKQDEFNTFFKLQHGRQHPVECQPNEYSEGWDGQKIRQENVFKYDRADTILSQAGVFESIRKQATQKVMKEDLQGFSRYYEGIDGAALGFATLYKYDDLETANDSYLVDVAEEMFDINGAKLVEYVWRKYGGTV